MTSHDLQKEKQLLIAAKQDKEKFAELYEYFINDVYRFSYSLTLNKSEADDIASQTFLTFYQKIDSYEWQGTTIKSWLFRTARNHIYMSNRRKPMDQFDESIDIKDEYEISFVDEVINKDLIKRVEEEINKFNVIDREVLVLRLWEGLRFKQIAEIQEATENATKRDFIVRLRGLERVCGRKGMPNYLLYQYFLQLYIK